MKITVLMENTSLRGNLHGEHGLGVLAQSDTHQLLVDTGPSPATWQNADALGIDLSGVDTVVLSHGHWDHTGGLLSGQPRFPNAEIYLQDSAGDDYFSFDEGETPRYVGIDKEILHLPRVHRLSGNYQVDSNLFLFADVSGNRFWPRSNARLKVRRNGQYLLDSFAHEQYAVLTEKGKTVLLSGCAHRGIVNILNRFYELYGRYPDYVISGLHLLHLDFENPEVEQETRELAKYLSKTTSKYYTGHCTTAPGYALLRSIMGEQIHEIHTGDSFEL